MQNPQYLLTAEPTNKQLTSAEFLSVTLAALLALIVGTYWPFYATFPDLAAAIMRPLVFSVAVLLALLWSNLPLTRVEARLLMYSAWMCLILVAPSLSATIVSRAIADWLKLVILCVVSVFLSRALRHKKTAKAFGVSLIISGLILAVFIVVTYLKIMGLVWPTYQSARGFKSLALKVGVPLNAVPFASVFAYIMGMCLVRGRKMLWLVGLVLLVISTVLTGSRAPAGILVASVAAFILSRGLVSQRFVIRVFSCIAVIAIIIAVGVALDITSFKTMSSITEGRWDFWDVAWQKFSERPILGYGFDSWRDDLVSRLPGQYELTSHVAKMVAGGYHNEYITLLAEQGIVGCIAVLPFFYFLLHSCWSMSSLSLQRGNWALFAGIYLLFRACVEMPGLFGYSQEPADYLAYLFVAIVVSRLSLAEDASRRLVGSVVQQSHEARLATIALRSF